MAITGHFLVCDTDGAGEFCVGVGAFICPTKGCAVLLMLKVVLRLHQVLEAAVEPIASAVP